MIDASKTTLLYILHEKWSDRAEDSVRVHGRSSILYVLEQVKKQNELGFIIKDLGVNEDDRVIEITYQMS